MPQFNVGHNSPAYTQVNTAPYKFQQEFKWKQSEPFFGDLGYSLPLPWPDVTTAGYLDGGNMGKTPGMEVPAPNNRLPEQKQLILSDQPEWYALNNRINSLGGMPLIDTRDPIFSYKRSDRTVNIQ